MDLDPEAVVGRVLRFVEARELIPAGAVAVAVSGGQDSLCLLDILRRLRDRLGIRLHVAHLNHSFRGAQADEEAEYVRALAADWGLPATVAALDVPAFRARHRLAKQVAARYARYQFLIRVAGQAGAERVAVGHTADDAVETLLMNLLRGSGLAGLRGLAPSRRLAPGQLGPALDGRDWLTEELVVPEAPLPLVVRPLLELYRAETESYCRARALDFRQDPSNLDPTYRRNWVRSELLPLLERHVPGVRGRLSDAADLLSDEYSLVARAVEESWAALARVGEGRVEFDLRPWARLEVPLRRHLLRRAVESLAGSLEDLGRTHVEAGEAILRRGQTGAAVDLPGGIRLEKGYSSFWLVRAPALPPRSALAEPVPLPLPGVVELAGAVLEAEVVEVAGGTERWRDLCSGTRWEACLDAAKVGPELFVRRRRPGDRFVPLGMDRAKKLHDFLVDEKVPRSERDAVPVVANPERIVWVAGHRIDDRFKVTPDTRAVVRLRLRRTTSA